MAISSIESVLQQMRAVNTSMSAERATSASGDAVGGGSFADALKSSLDRISEAQQQAYGQAEAFELGKPGVTLSDVMIDLQKANIGFQMSLQVRNKLVAAYQEIMNMPA